MIRLASLIKTFEARFMERYKGAILPSHQKALSAMQQCRKRSNHHMLAECTGCHKRAFIPHSCGHRSCPHCQNHEGWRWIENQLSKQLPTQYYLITFTLPYQLRQLAWQNQKVVYALMFMCVKELLKTFTRNDKAIKGSCRIYRHTAHPLPKTGLSPSHPCGHAGGEHQHQKQAMAGKER